MNDRPRIEKLRRDHHVDLFDCGQEALNRFLVRYAFQNQQAEASQTYVALVGDEVVGFYTAGRRAEARAISCAASRVDGHAVRTGTENEKVAPGPSFGSAQRRPSCLSMIERLTNNPMPIPPLFVE